MSVRMIRFAALASYEKLLSTLIGLACLAIAPSRQR